MSKRTAVALAFGLAAACSMAGTISEALISGQVQQFTDKGAVTGCGLVLVALEVVTGPSDVVQVFNGSYSLLGLNGGLVKGRGATITSKQVLAGNLGAKALKPQRTEGVWLKAPEAKATSIMQGQGLLKSDDPGYILYMAELRPLLALSDAVIAGKPIQIGLKTPARNYDVILSGVVQLTEAQHGQFAQCLSDWSASLNEKYKGDAPNDSGSDSQSKE